jgi:thioredoxin 1
MSKVREAAAADVENALSDTEGTYVIDFYADWCGPCKSLLPILDSISEKSEDVTFLKINVDKNIDIAKDERFKVKSIPQMFFIKGGEVRKSILGLKSEQEIRSTIDSL